MNIEGWSRGLVVVGLLLTLVTMSQCKSTIVFFPHPLAKSIKSQLQSAPAWPHCSKFANGKCAPAIIIAGSKKCGTNMLHTLLQKHPTIKFPSMSSEGLDLMRSVGVRPFGEHRYLSCELFGKENFANELFHCLDNNRSFSTAIDAVATYSNMFDSTDWKTSFAVDRSPQALHGPHAATKLWQISPNARVIITVCNPITRVWSAMNHVVKCRAKDPMNVNLTDAVVDGWLHTMVNETMQAIAKYNLTTTSLPLEAVLQCIFTETGTLGERCRNGLLPGFHKEGLRNFENAGFRPHQLIAVNTDTLYKDMERGTREIFQALSIPFPDQDAHPVSNHSQPVNSGAHTNKFYRPHTTFDLEKFNDMLSKVYHFPNNNPQHQHTTIATTHD